MARYCLKKDILIQEEGWSEALGFIKLLRRGSRAVARDMQVEQVETGSSVSLLPKTCLFPSGSRKVPWKKPLSFWRQRIFTWVGTGWAVGVLYRCRFMLGFS